MLQYISYMVTMFCKNISYPYVSSYAASVIGSERQGWSMWLLISKEMLRLTCGFAFIA